VTLFLLAAGVPFVLSFACFLISQRGSLLTEPEEYIAALKQARRISYRIGLSAWKHALARNPLCSEADEVVIGSSRVREIDTIVAGTSVCNLYVEGLSAPGFARLAQALAPPAPGEHHVVYVGLDHFWLWSVDTRNFAGVEHMLLTRARPLWRVWAALQPLNFFTGSDLFEAMRRYRQSSPRFEDQANGWYYLDGHVFYASYYAKKRAGLHHSVSQQEIEESVRALFHQGRVRESHLHALEAGVRHLHAKGYAVRLFWNPLSYAHLEATQRLFPVLFQQTIEAIDRLASTLPLDHYFPASQTLDASRFGCTESDDFDELHVDIDCLRRVFSVAFHSSKAHT